MSTSFILIIELVQPKELFGIPKLKNHVENNILLSCRRKEDDLVVSPPSPPWTSWTRPESLWSSHHPPQPVFSRRTWTLRSRMCVHSTVYAYRVQQQKSAKIECAVFSGKKCAEWLAKHCSRWGYKGRKNYTNSS
jgi:hypothetical protein